MYYRAVKIVSVATEYLHTFAIFLYVIHVDKFYLTQHNIKLVEVYTNK